MISLFFIGFLLVVAAGVLRGSIWFINKRTELIRRYNMIEEGEICYADLSVPAKPLFSRRYRLMGKPDYIVRRNKNFIPVEVKTVQSENTPYKGHILQLAAYCQILEDVKGCFVPFGILVYGGKQRYKIPFDPSLRFELEQTIHKMNQSRSGSNLRRNHDEAQRCRACSLREYCDEKIV